jgi:NTE family protein
VAPTQSLDALAQKFTSELPAAIRHALGALGVLKGSGGTLASYLLFEPRFVQSLMALGDHDAMAMQSELMELVLGA